MARQFEVTHRDGAARLGTLQWRGKELSTPYCFESKDELEFLKKLAACGDDLSVVVIPTDEETVSQQIDADIVLLAGAARFRNDPHGLIKALLRGRELTNPDSALYAPALATPMNVSLLTYAGIDLVDSIVPEAKAREGYFVDADGEWRVDEFSRRACFCRACDGENLKELSFEQRVALAADHNTQALQTELSKLAGNIERGTLRELIEGKCRAAPALTALLRLLDGEYTYLEERSPVVRTATMLACTQESLTRPEIRRFSERVIARLRRRNGILLLLPCSAKKPYSRSRSHRIILSHLGHLRQHINEAIITSPIGVVPRGLEIMYPASNYDIPVTGEWTCDEREWVTLCLTRYLSANGFQSVVSHVSGPYRKICDAAAESLGIEVIHTVEEEDILSSASLKRLRDVAHDLIDVYSPPRRDLRFDYVQDLADYEFGAHASEVIFPQAPKIRGLFPTYYALDHRRRIATITGKYQTLALTIEGARRYTRATDDKYCVLIDDFEPKGTVFAIGVLNADPDIRPFDEVIVLNDHVIGVGRALMSGWEMNASKRGGAVAVRHVESL